MPHTPEEIIQASKTAFIDMQVNSNLAIRPKFISNDYKRGVKVLSNIEEELRTCDEFLISVAFVTKSGITPLLQILKELEQKGIKGRIMTTNYLTFSEPEALKKLNELQNVEVRMYRVNPKEEGFHTKGYLFRHESEYKIIVGSSNLTQKALTLNKEWNMQIFSTRSGEIANDVLLEFECLWADAISLDSWIDTYTQIYEEQKKVARHLEYKNIISLEKYTLKPNRMQVAFVENLRKIREKGEERALLISATGTGKTYASAFALREENPHKALFLVHREQIAKQAIKSYKRVFDNTKSLGLLSGTSKDYEADYLFATMQTMAKSENLQRYGKKNFEIIIIDEVHRAGAVSYQKIMDYFEPDFWLGMTASPERTDGFDIYELFHHNIAYEIRLQQALEENLLCPFHYFGITDLEIDGKVFDDNAGIKNFSNLVCDARVDYVMEKMEYYGFSGDRVKGLIFCSRKEEAKTLSNKFNLRGYHTVFLGGDDSQERREEYIDRLTNDARADKLDYIFTVDIFNEGVDIPEINQVIMLRPTQSPIVFIQQLGRGLRKAENKEFVVILDFIGNYMNNFMIPIALSGDRTYNKDTIRKYVANGSRMIPGSSTIHFDEISKERIYSSIDKLKGIKRIIKESYQNLKCQLGQIPTLMDFYKNGEIDPLLILENYKSYYGFLKQIEEKYAEIEFTIQEVITLEYLSKVIAQGKRPHEAVILQELMNGNSIDAKAVQLELKSQYKVDFQVESINNALEVLEGKFVSKKEELQKYSHIEILQESKKGFYERMSSFSERIQHNYFYKHIIDLVELGLCRYKDIYSETDNRRGPFVLYEKYSRRDVCQLFNWGADFSSTMYGMKRVDDNVAIFVTYHKGKAGEGEEYLDGKPDYTDVFEDNQIFMWESQMGKGPDSSYMRDVKEASQKHLFIKKNDAEGVDFYYMGQFDIMEIEGGKKKDKNGKYKEISRVRVKMHDIVRDDLLEYLQKK
ncbi:MAG: DEAD/DEAH box helicase [Lachnospiraceae bacterium]